MEPTETSNDNERRLMHELGLEADRLLEDVLHSEQSHFEASRLWWHAYTWSGILLTVLSAGAAASGINGWIKLGAALSAGAAVVAALLTFLRPEERHQLHRGFGNRYLALRGKARRFKNLVLVAEADLNTLRRKLESLVRRKDELNSESPGIPRPAHKLAKRRIEDGEPCHRADVLPAKRDDDRSLIA